jgi:L-threonylcarbamoyladenylate synthase
MKYKHYAPKSTLVLVDGEPDELIGYIEKENKKQSVAIVCYTEDISCFSERLPSIKCFNFGNKSNQSHQAQRLFSLLREIDEEKFDLIYAPLPDTDGIGLALYNRMIRAAAHKIIKL